MKSNPINPPVLCQMADQTSDPSSTENNTTVIINPKNHDKETLMEATDCLFFKNQVWSSFYDEQIEDVQVILVY